MGAEDEGRESFFCPAPAEERDDEEEEETEATCLAAAVEDEEVTAVRLPLDKLCSWRLFVK